eukprot:4936934-Amphidinium_carterae.3
MDQNCGFYPFSKVLWGSRGHNCRRCWGRGRTPVEMVHQRQPPLDVRRSPHPQRKASAGTPTFVSQHQQYQQNNEGMSNGKNDFKSRGPRNP